MWSWQTMQFWYSRVQRLLRHDRRWTVELLPEGHRDWRDDWREARCLEVVEGRAAAFERAVEIAMTIEAGG